MGSLFYINAIKLSGSKDVFKQAEKWVKGYGYLSSFFKVLFRKNYDPYSIGNPTD